MKSAKRRARVVQHTMHDWNWMTKWIEGKWDPFYGRIPREPAKGTGGAAAWRVLPAASSAPAPKSHANLRNLLLAPTQCSGHSPRRHAPDYTSEGCSERCEQFVTRARMIAMGVGVPTSWCNLRVAPSATRPGGGVLINEVSTRSLRQIEPTAAHCPTDSECDTVIGESHSVPASLHPFLSLIYPQSPAGASFNLYSQSPSYPGYISLKQYTGPVTADAPLPGTPPATPVSCGQYMGFKCQKTRYRTYDGSCNNQQQPSWGMANTKYARLLPAIYADNFHAPPVALSGNPLPNARKVSFTIFPDVDIQDQKWTLVAMQWGQIITHDMGLVDGTTQSTSHPTQCCTDQGVLIQEALSSPLCFPIIIPPNDPVYSYERQQCHNFVRSTTDFDRGCSSAYQPAEQLTTVSHFLDLSIIYGSSNNVATSLRAGVGGRLNVDVRGNREWMPAARNKSAFCDITSENDVCYMAGDNRLNQNPQLTILHLILYREHNRIAGELTKLNPHWSDETTFQETRRINIAIHQQISYYEWLPIFIGQQNAENRRILYQTKGWVNDYDANVDPSTINEHSNAAFRYFHSLIAGKLLLVEEPRYAYSYNALRLSDHFNRPGVIEQNLDSLTRGMAFQPQEQSDQWFDREITNYLFRNRRRLGHDLRAVDIQRNRDHALASYNSFRAFTGLPRAVLWTDFGDLISPENIQKLSQLYERPDDVDLTVGGSLERHVDNTLIGPVFLNIISEQFWRTRVGDRYWYETGDPEIAFTIEQLAEIRKASIARLLCDNADEIQLMQLRGFEQVSQSNPLVRCQDIPAVDLSLWKDIQSPVWTSPSYSPWAKK